MEDLNSKSLAELKLIAKNMGLKGVSTLKKAQLAEAIEAASARPAAKPEKQPAAGGRPEQSMAADPRNEQRMEDRETGTAAAGGERPQKEQAVSGPAAAGRSREWSERPASEKSVGRGQDVKFVQNRHTSMKFNRNNASGNSFGGQRRNDRPQNGRGDRQQGGRDRQQNDGQQSRPLRSYEQRPENRHPAARPAEPVIPVDEMEMKAAELNREEILSYDIQPSRQRTAESRTELPPGVEDISALDSGEPAYGILEVMQEGFGFIRCENYLPGDDDVYVSPSQIRRFNLKTGDIINGSIRIRTGQEKFAALLYVREINGESPAMAEKRKSFEELTPVFPHERIRLEAPGCRLPMRVMDLVSPIGKGQRGMIVSPPKAGKTTLLKQVAASVLKNHPEMHLIILLIDERPEEVTDMKESIVGDNVEIIYSTFDELPDHHKRVSEMVINRAKRLVEHGRDVMILLDSITRLSRAYNLVVSPSGRTLSGGLDPTALYMPKKFFGAARCMREGGSLTILATALVDTGSRMDDVVFEEFKGTGNMELVLDRKLSEKRIFPAIDMLKSGTRREELLLTKEEYDGVAALRKASMGMKPEEAIEHILDLFLRTKNNSDLMQIAQKIRT